MMFSKTKMILYILLFLTLGVEAQIYRPGGVNNNLNLWISSTNNVLKTPISVGANTEYVFDWKFVNNSSQTFVPSSIQMGPLYYSQDSSRKLNQHGSVSFFSDSVNRYMYCTGTLLNIDTVKSLYIFVVPSLRNTVNASKNPVLSSLFLPSSNNHFEINLGDSLGQIGWKHGLPTDTFYRPILPIQVNKPYLWTFKLEVDSLRENISNNGKMFSQKSNPNSILNTFSLYPNLGYSKTTIGTEAYGNFNLGEVIVYQGFLSNYQIHKIESFLAFKYGITLLDAAGSAKSMISSKDSTYIWNAITAGAYSYHVAGIGKDSISGLFQKQNKHAYDYNKGDMLSMGFENINYFNNSNNYNFGTNRDAVFYTWSDNNDSVNNLNYLDINNQILDSACVSRMPREWMIQRTLKDTVIKRRAVVKFDLSNTIDLSQKSLFNFRLMVDQDGNGNFKDGNVQYIFPTTLNNNILSFDTVYWDEDKNGVDVFTLLYDLNIVKPKLHTKDTVYGVLGQQLNIYSLFSQLDTLANVYKFYDSNRQLIHTSSNGSFTVSSSQTIYVGVEDKNIKCQSNLKKVFVYFRPVLQTFKTVKDANASGTCDLNEILSYKIYVINVDSITHTVVNSIKIVDTIPDRTTYVANSVSSPGGFSPDYVTFNYSNANLKYGDTLVIVPSFQVKADSFLYDVDTISNLAKVQFVDPKTNDVYTLLSGCPKTNAVCGVHGESIILTTRYYADLGITKKVISTNNVKVGENIIYQVIVKNTGPSTAYGIDVVDTLPSNFSFSNLTSTVPLAQYIQNNKTIVWKIDSLTNTQTAELTYNGNITAGPWLINTATIKGLNPDTIQSNNKVVLKTEFSSNPLNENDFPTVITPNGDGANDRFIIPGLSDFPGSEITIFDRWGSEVYHSSDYKNNWEPNTLNDGTYYYVLKVNNTPVKQVVKKWIQLIH